MRKKFELGEGLSNWNGVSAPKYASIEGRHVRIEKLEKKHFSLLYEALKEAAYEDWLYLSYGPFKEYDEFLQWLELRISRKDPDYRIHLTNSTKARSEVVGICSYLNIAKEAGSIEIGNIQISVKHQRGIAFSEAVFLMAEYVFSHGYRRFEWKCNALNTRSRRAAQRFGFHFEGIFRQALVVKGRNRDTAWFSIIDKEWPALASCYRDWLSPSNFDALGRQKKALSRLTKPFLKNPDPMLEKEREENKAGKKAENTNIYVIISAFREEMRVFKKHFSMIERKSAPFIFYEAEVYEKKIVFALSGVGKVSTAMATQRIIDFYQPKAVLFTGLAAALNSDYEIGDIVVARDCIQYDVDASYLGFPRGNIPYTKHRFFQSSRWLLDIAGACIEKNESHKVHIARVLTSDLFVDKERKLYYKTVFQDLQGDAVEMEAAAFAHVCTVNKIPFIVVKSISDKADDAITVDFAKNLQLAAQNSFKLIHRMLKVFEK